MSKLESNNAVLAPQDGVNMHVSAPTLKDLHNAEEQTFYNMAVTAILTTLHSRSFWQSEEERKSVFAAATRNIAGEKRPWQVLDSNLRNTLSDALMTSSDYDKQGSWLLRDTRSRHRLTDLHHDAIRKMTSDLKEEINTSVSGGSVLHLRNIGDVSLIDIATTIQEYLQSGMEQAQQRDWIIGDLIQSGNVHKFKSRLWALHFMHESALIDGNSITKKWHMMQQAGQIIEQGNEMSEDEITNTFTELIKYFNIDFSQGGESGLQALYDFLFTNANYETIKNGVVAHYERKAAKVNAKEMATHNKRSDVQAEAEQLAMNAVHSAAKRGDALMPEELTKYYKVSGSDDEIIPPEQWQLRQSDVWNEDIVRWQDACARLRAGILAQVAKSEGDSVREWLIGDNV